MKKLLLSMLFISALSPILLPAQCNLLGSNITVCSAQTAVSVSATQTGYSSFLWTTSGSGTFASSTTPSGIYTPSSADIIAGTVNLTISATGGSCSAASAVSILTIVSTPVVNAGLDQISCGNATVNLSSASATGTGNSFQWTSSGTGAFSNITVINPTYTPSATDVAAGNATLTFTATSSAGCTSSDQVNLTLVTGPVVSAGLDQTSCGNATVNLSSASATGTGNSFQWTSNGTGAFSNITVINPTYTPSATDVAAGNVTVTFTATSITGCTSSDQVKLTLITGPVVSAGLDQTSCGNATVNLSSASATGTGNSFQWTSSGTGAFSNITVINPTYTPSATDVAAGNVTVTLTAISSAGCTSSDQVKLTLVTSPVVSAGLDQTVTGTSVSLSGSASGTASFLWSSSGSGTFSNSSSLTTVYTPSTLDRTNGLVTLILTDAGSGVCTATPDKVLITLGNAFSISGTVRASTNTLDNGTVLLFKKDPAGILRLVKEDLLTSSNAGEYTFENIPAGKYVILAIPSSTSTYLNNYLPTYSGSTQDWNTAQEISITENATYPISLSAYTSANPSWNTGTDILSGTIYLSPPSSPVARIEIVGIPAPYVTVYLTNTTGNKIAYTQTDINGRYAFNNVKAGSYAIAPDFAGTNLQDNALLIPITSDGNPATAENVSMTLQEKVSVATGIITVKSVMLAAYPNPTKNIFYLDVQTKVAIGEVKFFNSTGMLVFKEQVDLKETSISLNIETLPLGIYVVQLSAGDEVYISKIIKY